MANEKHLAILREALEKKDIGIWNKWRKERPDIIPDLREVNLRGADLREVKFRGAELRDADLRNANLQGTDLRGAKLRGANLSDANLTRANLMSANLTDAVLNDAVLSNSNLMNAILSKSDLSNTNLKYSSLYGADLRYTNLSDTKLEEADFENTRCSHTIFANVDISQALNLDKVKHLGPSSIGIDTLYKSGGKIPREFLEGCGVPETMITFAKSLVGTAIEFYSCFISYNSQDEEFCKQLAARMKDAGLRVWFAPDDIQGGKKIHEQVYEAIRYHDKLIVVLSEHSMQSNWVETEIRRARKRERDDKRRVLFPIRLVDYEALRDWELFDADEGRDLAQEIREYFIPDFSEWKDYDKFTSAFDRLLADLRKDEEV